MICDITMLLSLGIIVSNCNKYVSTSECVEFIIAPPFHMRIVPDLIVFSHLHKSGNILIKWILSIHRSPQWLSVLWIVSTIEALFRPVVDYRNALRKNCESESCLEEGRCRSWVAEEAGVVMVVYEDSQGIHICEGSLLFHES